MILILPTKIVAFHVQIIIVKVGVSGLEKFALVSVVPRNCWIISSLLDVYKLPK